MPTCIFGCDAPRLTREHIFGRRWIAQVMAIGDGKLKHTHAKVKGQRPFVVAGRETFAVEWEATEPDLIVKGVCPSCNSGWMDRMDRDAHPLVEPMARGLASALSMTGQRQVATWSTKLAMLFDTHLEHPALPLDLRMAFRETRRPLADSHVWLGRYDLPWGTWKAGGLPTTKAEDAPFGKTNAYLCTININYLLIQVLVPVAAYDVLPYARTMERAWGGHLRRIWPPLLGAASVDWPPPLSVRPDEYAAFGAMEAPPIVR